MNREEIVNTLKGLTAVSEADRLPDTAHRAIRLEFDSIALALVGEDRYADAVKSTENDEIIRIKHVKPIMRQIAEALMFIIRRELGLTHKVFLSVHVVGVKTKKAFPRDFLIELNNQFENGHCLLFELTKRGKVVECDLDRESARIASESWAAVGTA